MKQKLRLIRIFIAGAGLLAGFFLPLENWWSLGYYLLFYGIIGWDIIWKAVRNILRGQVFDENFLMAVATIGAFCLREYTEAMAVMLFYQVGEWFQALAVQRSRKSIASLMDIRPDYANIQRDGQLVQVDPEEVKPGDQIVVKPGERVPLDGIVREGNSYLDTSALTGESVPREAAPGDEIISGCVNQSGLLTVEVTKPYGESTVAKILDLVENSSSKKAKAEHFITKFARYYTPAVVGAALLLAVIPPLFLGGWGEWVYRALTFLVISCPCALVISVPLSFFAGIGGASKAGVLVKGGNYLEALARTESVVFDKTGTLTKGVFQVTRIESRESSPEEFLELAALAESYSDHPISQSIQKAYGNPFKRDRVQNVKEIPGQGVCAEIDGRRVLAGNRKLMEREKISCEQPDMAGTVVHLAADGVYQGYLVIADQLKPDAKPAMDALRCAGVKQLVMLTGDNQNTAEQVASQLGLDQYYADLLPVGKVERMEELLASKSPRGTLAFVGDGINDAPVLARADIGIAMGGLGSDAAIEAADVVIMTDEPSKIALVIRIARKTQRIVRENIVFALGVKGLVLLMGAFGIANMWTAVFADVGVAVIAILNAIRALWVPKK